MVIKLLTRQIRRFPYVRDLIRFCVTSFSIHVSGCKKDICIFSCRRSGSTWLMETLAAEKKMKFVNEPFVQSMVKKRKLPSTIENVPYLNRKTTCVPEGTDEIYKKYLTSNFATKIRGPYNPFNKDHHLISNRRVIKVVHGTALVPWFLSNLTDIGRIYLIRHPIPTALSMTKGCMVRSESNLMCECYVDRYLAPEMIELATKILAGEDDLKKYVLEWCLDNLPIIRALSDDKEGLLITYEELLVNPIKSVELIASKFEIKDINRLCARTRLPSASTAEGRENYLINTDSISKIGEWAKFINKERLDELMSVVKAFSIDMYTEDMATPKAKYLHFSDTPKVSISRVYRDRTSPGPLT